ncbi:DinB family protein, partial [Xanthovirga aplysinae]|uniref:DinB family protein n=1 Tax=Xanthovirga aplysinae TaxID=2529853 RepID=UPI0012BBD196
GRTERLFQYIPEDKIEWTYQAGKFTIGDIIRHLALIERKMYVENIQQRPSLYNGCGIEYANGFEEVIQFYRNMHQESLAIFSKLSNADLKEKSLTPGGVKITNWKWLRAMVEHEVHHRGQIYIYLGMLNVKTPPIYGLTSEEVIANSAKE